MLRLIIISILFLNSVFLYCNNINDTIPNVNANDSVLVSRETIVKCAKCVYMLNDCVVSADSLQNNNIKLKNNNDYLNSELNKYKNKYNNMIIYNIFTWSMILLLLLFH